MAYDIWLLSYFLTKSVMVRILSGVKILGVLLSLVITYCYDGRIHFLILLCCYNYCSDMEKECMFAIISWFKSLHSRGSITSPDVAEFWRLT